MSYWEALLRARDHRSHLNSFSAGSSEVPCLPCPVSYSPSLQSVLWVCVYCRVALSWGREQGVALSLPLFLRVCVQVNELCKS